MLITFRRSVEKFVEIFGLSRRAIEHGLSRCYFFLALNASYNISEQHSIKFVSLIRAKRIYNR